MTALPVVDVSGLSAADRAARRATAAELGRACEQVGFLSVVGHGIPQQVIDDAFAAAHRFFALPVERKAFATLTEGVLNRGYDGLASQQLDPSAAAADLKEVWDVGLDLPWDHPLVLAGTPMHGPNPWPDDLPWFRPPVEAFYDAARALTERLLAGMALALGLDERAFEPFHREPIATMRLLHYPPRSAGAPDGQLGAGAHTDWGAVTVLTQDDVGGLQVLDGDGETWVDVPPVAGSFVVNIGDLMARLDQRPVPLDGAPRRPAPGARPLLGRVLHGPRPPRRDRGAADLCARRRAASLRADDCGRAPAGEVPRVDARPRRHHRLTPRWPRGLSRIPAAARGRRRYGRGVRVLAACSLGGAGHLHPLVPFLDAARLRGDDTLVAGPAAIAGLVERTGHPFAPGGEPAEVEIAPIRERLPEAPQREASVLGNRELFGRLATTALLPDLARAVDRFSPDLILRDPCEYASAIVARDRGIPVAQVAIGLAGVEWGSIDVAAPALDAHRPGLTDVVRASPYLSRFPSPLDPSPFPDTRRYREPPAAAADPLPDWWAGSTAPLVYASFGTVLGHMTIAADAYRTLVRAVAPLDARVLITVGRAVDVATLGPVPGHVRVEQWVDQSRVLPDATTVVCHGGSGTTYGALAAGCPVVIVPLFADQFANARAVAGSGAGLAVGDERDAERGRPDLTGGLAARLTGAVETVLATPSYRARARRIAGDMAAAPGVIGQLGDLASP